MRTDHKVTSAALVLFLSLACNFCLVECVFASEEHDHAAQANDGAGHPHESKANHERPDSEEHDAASLCCSSLVAVKSVPSQLTHPAFTRELFSLANVPGRLLQKQSKTLLAYQVEFPPGASLPAAYLLTHFTHAPPSYL